MAVKLTGARWAVQCKFEPRDAWVGVFWDRKPKDAPEILKFWDIYICIVPFFPIRIFQGIWF